MKTQPSFSYDFAIAVIRPAVTAIILLVGAKLLFPLLPVRSLEEFGIAVAGAAFLADLYSQRTKANAEQYNQIRVDIGKLQDAIERHEASMMHTSFEDLWATVQKLTSSNSAQIAALKELILFSDRLSKIESTIEKISCETGKMSN